MAELEAEREMTLRLAQTDSLTGLVNRGAFTSGLCERLEAARETGVQVALFVIDLDRFKSLNDSLGHHAGDMPNLHIPATGELTVEVVNAAVTLDKGKPNSLFGGEGTALVIHAGKDDYKSDPTGEAGGRIACGVVQ